MARSQKKISTISAIVAGSIATITLPLGATYDQIKIRHKGMTLAQMKNVRLNVNGKVVSEYKTGVELDALNKFYGRLVVAGVLDFHFNQPEMKTLPEKRMFGLGTASPDGVRIPFPVNAVEEKLMPAVQSVTITFDIDAAATNPSIEVAAIVSNPVPMGQLVKVKRYPKLLSAGVNEFDDLPKNRNAKIKAVHLVTAATIEQCSVFRNGTEITQLDYEWVKHLQREHDRIIQPNYYTTDFVLEGDMKQALDLMNVNDLRLRIETADDTTASTYCEVIVEYFDVLEGGV